MTLEKVIGGSLILMGILGFILVHIKKGEHTSHTTKALATYYRKQKIFQNAFCVVLMIGGLVLLFI